MARGAVDSYDTVRSELLVDVGTRARHRDRRCATLGRRPGLVAQLGAHPTTVVSTVYGQASGDGIDIGYYVTTGFIVRARRGSFFGEGRRRGVCRPIAVAAVLIGTEREELRRLVIRRIGIRQHAEDDRRFQTQRISRKGFDLGPCNSSTRQVRPRHTQRRMGTNLRRCRSPNERVTSVPNSRREPTAKVDAPSTASVWLRARDGLVGRI